jgi:hypothetical protein
MGIQLDFMVFDNWILFMKIYPLFHMSLSELVVPGFYFKFTFRKKYTNALSLEHLWACLVQRNKHTFVCVHSCVPFEKDNDILDQII